MSYEDRSILNECDFVPLSSAAKKQEAIDAGLKEYDEVHRPKHYDLFPDTEAIDVIEKTLTPEEFKGYLKGNALKYRLRAGNKNDAMQDIKKADWYTERLRAGHEL